MTNELTQDEVTAEDVNTILSIFAKLGFYRKNQIVLIETLLQAFSNSVMETSK